ncbi:MAG: hydrogenase maturation protease [Chloroflexi bacterium]|jgi:hypothetical protein|nr:MAG: hydrogenase maturation protease [Chloroflexota bacterium]
MENWLLELTTHGYLHMPAVLAERYFPSGVLVAFLRDNEIWLAPLRGPAAGGLLLKQRNARGDRSVLLWEVLPPTTPPGYRRAVWDEEHGVLRIARDPTLEHTL